MKYLKLIFEMFRDGLLGSGKRNKILVIPVEINVRELNGAIQLAHEAAKKGWFVIIGGKSSLFPVIPFLPSAFVYLKSIVPGEVQIQKSLRRFGHRNICHDIEGLTPSNGPSGIKLRFSAASIEEVAHVFFWGKRQWQDTVEQFPELKKKSSVSGSPIVDFWHAHQAWLAKTRRKPDDILFATSFPIVNHPMGKEYFYRSINDAAPDALKEFKAEFDQDAEIQQLGLDLYQDLLVKLATAFPQRTIYLRPHPTEDQDVWNRIKQQHQNIVFARDGEIGSWFDKVGYFIHYNSTTAIQASFYGLDIYSLLPGDRTGIDARFSEPVRLVTTECDTSEAIIKNISNDAAQKTALQSFSSIGEFLENAQQGHEQRGASTIVTQLETLFDKEESMKMPRSSLIDAMMTLTVKPLIISCLAWLSYHAPFRSGRMDQLKNRYIYGKLKQPEYDWQAIKESLDIIGASERDVRLRLINRKLFILKRADDA